MNLTPIFKTKHRSTDTCSKISETMKRTGALWKRYLELQPDGYNFTTCKEFRTYLHRTHDQRLIDLLGGYK